MGLFRGKAETYLRETTIWTNAMATERCIGVMALFTKVIGSTVCNKGKEDLSYQMAESKKECSGKTNTLELQDNEILLFVNSNSSNQFLNKTRSQKRPNKKSVKEPSKAQTADLSTKLKAKNTKTQKQIVIVNNRYRPERTRRLCAK